MILSNDKVQENNDTSNRPPAVRLAPAHICRTRHDEMMNEDAIRGDTAQLKR